MPIGHVTAGIPAREVDQSRAATGCLRRIAPPWRAVGVDIPIQAHFTPGTVPTTPPVSFDRLLETERGDAGGMRTTRSPGDAHARCGPGPPAGGVNHSLMRPADRGGIPTSTVRWSAPQLTMPSSEWPPSPWTDPPAFPRLLQSSPGFPKDLIGGLSLVMKSSVGTQEVGERPRAAYPPLPAFTTGARSDPSQRPRSTGRRSRCPRRC